MSSSSSSLRSKPEGDGEVPMVELRASVLDAAISLGFRNSVMKKWMFDPVQEAEDEEAAEHTSSTPALTSPSTSEESAMSPYSFFCPPGKPGSDAQPGAGEQFFTNNNVNISQAGFGPGSDYAGSQKGSTGVGVGEFGKVTLGVPPARNKLRKQQQQQQQRRVLADGNGIGYESDGGYVSEFFSTNKKANINGKAKSKRNIGWVRGRSKTRDADGEEYGGESDGGYLSEAVGSVSKGRKNAKTKEREKEREKDREKAYLNFLRERGEVSSPLPQPVGVDERDPEALLATIKASALPDAKSPSSVPGPSFVSGPAPGPESNSGHDGHTPIDGYLTDSASSEKRGRTKKKSTKSGRTTDKSKTRATSPSSAEDALGTQTPTKKKSIFRLMARSVSRDAKDRDRTRVEEETPPPMPQLPPLMPLPIAEKFARSGAGTPVGNGPASGSVSPSTSKPETVITTSLSSMDLRSSGSLDTLVPPTLRDLARSDSPWSYRSAPGRMGGPAEWALASERALAWERTTGSGSLELTRERKESSDLSPFSMIQRLEDSASTGNGEKLHSQSDHGHSIRSMSPIATIGLSTYVNEKKSPDIGRSPTKRIGKLFAGLGYSSNSGDSSANGKERNASPTSYKPEISLPNPHLTRKQSSLKLQIPNPLEHAAALTNSGRIDMNGGGNVNLKNLNDGRPITPGSFIIIDEDEGVPTPVRQQRFADTSAVANADGDEPALSNNVPPPTMYSSSGAPASPTSAALAARRRALLQGLGLDITPMQSRSVTPTPDANPNEDEVKAARASVLAYYQVPPPSPPPTGPLPSPPQFGLSSASASGFGSASPRQENDTQFLAPGRPYASRSPSPLGLGARTAISRSPSPGLTTAQQVRRGREPPFPTRPVLPPQDSRQLVERVERYKAVYATDASGSDGQFQDESGWVGDEVVDKHSSAYIREARARGEKRVYFDMNRTLVEEDEFPEDVDPVIPEIEVDCADESMYEDFDEQADERLRYSKLDATGNIRDLLREGAKDEFEDGGDEASSSRPSFATGSGYSRYSVLDADKSARIRDGLVKRVAALYEKDEGRLLREVIPDVPKVLPELRNGRPDTGSIDAAGQLGRTELKITSSSYRF